MAVSKNSIKLIPSTYLSSISLTKPGEKQLKLRVFAGPNGSGKSTVIDYVRCYKVNDRSIDFGYYINADEIAAYLRSGGFRFDKFDILVSEADFRSSAAESGLLSAGFTDARFKASYLFRGNMIRCQKADALDRLAQIIADYLRKRLLEDRKRFSFETVFSHRSKLDIMREAEAAGYKVYLYFVSTEAWEINAFRVKARHAKGGHDVPEDKIRSRYSRSLGLLYEAAQLAYQAFFFDNSVDNAEHEMFAHFKKSGDKKEWDDINESSVPNWFRKYYAPPAKRQSIKEI